MIGLTNSGFNVHIGDEMGPGERQAQERSDRCLVSSSISVGKIRIPFLSRGLIFDKIGESQKSKILSFNLREEINE